MIGSVTETRDQLDAIEKRKRNRERAAHDEAAVPALTDAHDMAQGATDAAEAARKAYEERGATAGPGEPLEPGPQDGPERYERPYVSEGHAAESPMAEPPRANPMPAMPRGILTPIALPDAPVAALVPAHITAGLSLGSPSDR